MLSKIEKLYSKNTCENDLVYKFLKKNDFEFLEITTSPSCPNDLPSKLLAV